MWSKVGNVGTPLLLDISMIGKWGMWRDSLSWLREKKVTAGVDDTVQWTDKEWCFFNQVYVQSVGTRTLNFFSYEGYLEQYCAT